MRFWNNDCIEILKRSKRINGTIRIVERGNIDTPYTHMHGDHFSGLVQTLVTVKNHYLGIYFVKTDEIYEAK